MSFIRTKTIKGNQYSYLVENKRINGKVVQKNLQYLGRVKNERTSEITQTIICKERIRLPQS